MAYYTNDGPTAGPVLPTLQEQGSDIVVLESRDDDLPIGTATLVGRLVPDQRGIAVLYMICEPDSHFYRGMTRSDRMPVLIEERI